MGPSILFDKSFLQSLKGEEAVFFDHFFYSIICPVFFIETLADLAKPPREGWTPEREVRVIAEKTPEVNSAPSLWHSGLLVQDLSGSVIPMDGRLLPIYGKPAQLEGRSGVLLDLSPEAAAFQRWQNAEFNELERGFAKNWREMLERVDLGAVAGAVRAMGIDAKVCKSFAEARSLVATLLSRKDNVADQIKLACIIAGASSEIEQRAVERWRELDCPSFSTLAPYSAYVVGVEVFF
jgi:hypothetical protein